LGTFIESGIIMITRSNVAVPSLNTQHHSNGRQLLWPQNTMAEIAACRLWIC